MEFVLFRLTSLHIIPSWMDLGVSPLRTLEEHWGPWELVRNAGSQAPPRLAECNSAFEDDPWVMSVSVCVCTRTLTCKHPWADPRVLPVGKEATHQAGFEPD